MPILFFNITYKILGAYDLVNEILDCTIYYNRMKMKLLGCSCGLETDHRILWCYLEIIKF